MVLGCCLGKEHLLSSGSAPETMPNAKPDQEWMTTTLEAGVYVVFGCRALREFAFEPWRVLIFHLFMVYPKAEVFGYHAVI